MQVLYDRCCGLEIHKKHVKACLLTLNPHGVRKQDRQRCGTTTADLIRLRDWLLAASCTHVAMESTGSYWKPIYNILEGYVALVLANAQHIKTLPGRKTDVG